MLQSQPISKQCDVYSYGIVLWELLTHRIPFEDVSNYEITKKVVEEKEVSNFTFLDFPRPFPTFICWVVLFAKPQYENKIKVERLGTLSLLVDPVRIGKICHCRKWVFYNSYALHVANLIYCFSLPSSHSDHQFQRTVHLPWLTCWRSVGTMIQT